MGKISEKSKIIYLFVLILFISAFGLFWMDYIGLVDMGKMLKKYGREAPSVVDAPGDEPSLVEREEFEKEKQKLQERVEDLDKREAMLTEKERDMKSDQEKLEEMKRGLDLEKKKFSDQKNEHSGYQKNVKKLADKINSMPPEESVGIIVNWEEPLIIDVLRQMDADAEASGKMSITSYLITLMPKEKASRIMYLMTQI
jgi:Skp family chaperone for outer membrane proteins